MEYRTAYCCRWRTNWAQADLQAKTDILKRSPDALTSDSTGLPVLIVNDAGVSKSISLGNSIYLDLDSNLVQESIVINPYSSKVLIHTGNYLSYTSSKQYIRSSDICRLTGNLTFYIYNYLYNFCPVFCISHDI